MGRPRSMTETGQRGFTLVEMLVALGILVLGFTSLIGLLGVGVSTRRTAELRNQAVQAVDAVLFEVRQRIASAPADGGVAPVAGAEQASTPEAAPAPGEAEVIVFDTVPGYDRLKAVATLVRDESHPTLVLVVIKITWLQEGIEVGEEFQRVLPAYEPFSRRAGRARNP